jgi:HlyD family secretion protein
MRTATIALTIFAAALPLLAQEPAVRRDQVWADTVKRGDMELTVRGLGAIVSGTTADLKIAETQVGRIEPGQTVRIDTRQSVLLNGKVSRIDSAAVNGTVAVSVQLDAASSVVPPAGTQVDGTIQIAPVNDIVYVGRPVFGQANSEATLFKLCPDGQSCTRVKVRFGQVSVNTIQVLEGLQPGDRVILSDMKAWDRYDRLRIQ